MLQKGILPQAGEMESDSHYTKLMVWGEGGYVWMLSEKEQVKTQLAAMAELIQ